MMALYFEILPNEMLLEILKRLDIDSLHNISSQNKRFFDLVRKAVAFKKIDSKYSMRRLIALLIHLSMFDEQRIETVFTYLEIIENNIGFSVKIFKEIYQTLEPMKNEINHRLTDPIEFLYQIGKLYVLRLENFNNSLSAIYWMRDNFEKRKTLGNLCFK